MGKFNLAEHIQAAQPPVSRDIETITREILDAKRAGGEAILTIGRGLIEAKSQLSHGEWLPWLEEKVEFSVGSANRFMRLAREWTNSSALTNLGATKALQLLALPESERDVFLSETHEVNGEEKTVIDMTSRELDAAIKARDEAMRAAEQAKADQRAADEAREKIARDMALANARIAGLNAEVDAQSARAKEAQDTAARLERELAELRTRPVDVAVEVDETAVETARKEVETAMQAKLDKANADAKKAKEDRRKAEDARARVMQELEQAKADAQALREQAAKTEKRAALTSNEELVLFRTLFDQTQEIVNKMSGVLMKVRNKEPDTAEKLSNALLALSDKVREVAQA